MAEREGPCPGHLLFPPASPGHCRHPPFPPMEGGDGTLGCLGVSPSMGTPWDALRGHWHMRRVRGSQLGGLQGVQRGGEPIPAVPRGGSPSSGGVLSPHWVQKPSQGAERTAPDPAPAQRGRHSPARGVPSLQWGVTRCSWHNGHTGSYSHSPQPPSPVPCHPC